jgi:aminobenzoyl-glutamate transport protein
MSNIAVDVGFVLFVPLGAMIFLAIGRHPLAGLAAAFAGVSGGFSANLLLSPLDPLLAGLTQEAARIINPAYSVNAAANYYFLIVSTLLITIVGTIITEKIVIPRLGEYKGEEQPEKLEPLSPAEKRGLWFALVAMLLFAAFLVFGTVPASGYLRNPETGGLLQSPFLSGIVALIFFAGALIGIAYGIGARTVQSDLDVMRAMEKAMETMAVYIVLAFFAAQFIAFFNWTNLGLITAVRGADGLRALNLGGAPLMVSFVGITMLLNLLMASASAKWALMAPIFVPMFMLLGYSPEMTQGAYRVGDSVTNIITPLMPYFPLIVAFAKRYDPQAGIGTMLATMLPYSVAFFIAWTLLLIVWFGLGWPLGPDAPLYYQGRP